MTRIVFLIISIFYGLNAIAETDNYCQATIYYFDWEVRTRSRLSIDDVKEKYSTMIHIKDEAEATQFVESLPIAHMVAVEDAIDPSKIDVRLVIDLVRCSGKVESYFSSRFVFANLEGSRSASINADFRNSFRFRAGKSRTSTN